MPTSARFAPLRRGSAPLPSRGGRAAAEALSDEALLRRVAELSAPLAQAVARDYERWPVARVYENPGIVRGPTVPSWEEQLQALRDHLMQRAAWMDAQL